MMRINHCIALWIVIGSAAALVSCAPKENPHPPAAPVSRDETPPPTDPALTIEGTVERLEVEGGCWVIRSADGKQYEPMGLTEEFRQNGLRVRAVIRIRPDMASICQVGTIAEVVSIERLT
jgi:hypothetical protein